MEIFRGIANVNHAFGTQAWHKSCRHSLPCIEQDTSCMWSPSFMIEEKQTTGYISYNISPDIDIYHDWALPWTCNPAAYWSEMKLGKCSRMVQWKHHCTPWLSAKNKSQGFPTAYASHAGWYHWLRASAGNVKAVDNFFRRNQFRPLHFLYYLIFHCMAVNPGKPLQCDIQIKKKSKIMISQILATVYQTKLTLSHNIGNPLDYLE